MDARKKLKRKPKQSRSTATVTAIVDAAAQLLLRTDYQSTSTNRIAELAGVSIGSVYQYFADKNEIYDAVLDSYSSRLVTGLRAVTPDPAMGLQETLEALVFSVYSADPDGPLLLRRIRQAPDAHFQEKLQNAKAQIAEFLRGVLIRRPESLDVSDLNLSLRILIDAVEGIFINAPVGQDPRVLARELARLIARYLLAPGPARPRTAG